MGAREDRLASAPTTRTAGNYTMLGVGEIVFPREEHMIGYSIPNGQP